jgi:hypothetical protein
MFLKENLFLFHNLCCHSLFKKEFEYLRIPISDDGSEDISNVIHKGADFIQFAGKGKNVLVHCQLGISRSVTVVIAWMVKYLKFSVCEALKQIRLSHPRANPNMGFLQQLVEYEEQITGMKSYRLVENCKLCLKLKFADELISFVGCRHSLCTTCNLKEANIGMCPHCGFEAQQRVREEQHRNRFTKEEKDDSGLKCGVNDIKHRIYSIC